MGENKRFVYFRERERERVGVVLKIACEHARTWGTDVSKPLQE